MSKVIRNTTTSANVILPCHENETAYQLQQSLNNVQSWLETWRIKVNEDKSCYVTFTNKMVGSPEVHINSVALPQGNIVKYFIMHSGYVTWKNKQQKLFKIEKTIIISKN